MSLPEPPTVPETWLTITLGELQEKGAILDIQDGNHGSDYPRKSEFTTQGVKFVTAVQMDGTVVDIDAAPCLPRERATSLRIGFAKGGDVLLSHNASVGKVARLPLRAGDLLIGTSVTYYRVNEQAIQPDYLTHFFRSGLFQQQLRWIMKQTTRNQVSVLKQVNLWMCVPPLAEQPRIVAYLDDLQAKVDAIKALQAKTAAELDALLPSILDKAFKGEL